LSVAGDFAVGNNGYVYNGVSDSDAATLSVGGNFSIGDSGAQPGEFGNVCNYGTSKMSLGGNYTLYGDGGSFVFNGLSGTDAAVLTVGGNFNLGANSFVYDFGTSDLNVTGNFTLGNTSYFVVYGTMSVGD